MFHRATKKQLKARIALMGPAGSGKTFTALRLATALAKGGPVAYIDTERGSASKYVGDHNPDGGVFAFDVVDDWPDFAVGRFIEAIRGAEAASYAALVIDSLSHAWSGPGGLLDYVDARTKAANSRNAFGTGWRDATPLHNELVDTMLRCKMHLIVTMRTKQEYIIEEVNGKKVPRKVGMQPIQRDGLEYEFDVLLDMDGSSASVSKTRCSELADKQYQKPGKKLADTLLSWLERGEVEAPAPPPFDSVAYMQSVMGEASLPWAAWEGYLAEKNVGITGLDQAKADKIIDRLRAKEDEVATLFFGGES